MHEASLTIAGQASVFQTACLSKRGGRESNQDFCRFVETGMSACWALADGLGGHHGGELASKTAVDTVVESFLTNPQVACDILERHLAAAQEAVLKRQKENPAIAQMRTTIVVLISDSRNVLWAHVGDSRLYRFQGRGLVAQTEDHSVPQALAKAGDIRPDQIRGHADRNRVLRSMGEGGPVRPAVLPAPEALSDGDAFLLCTDGYWEHILELEMLADLVASETPEEWLRRSELRLLQRASGEFDNYSAMAVFYVPRRVLPKTVIAESTERTVTIPNQPDAVPLSGARLSVRRPTALGNYAFTWKERTK